LIISGGGLRGSRMSPVRWSALPWQNPAPGLHYSDLETIWSRDDLERNAVFLDFFGFWEQVRPRSSYTTASVSA